ncbi:hypothetical protein [Flavobacterium eburneipallidum]|uniref:hypothetical protein n=1 Tax=Flavobacterium eburneipallidum TaxID=3003263 RepID=UPI0022ABFB4D|nr:hypothetical protein [Flavobacterium eburneipallidum]
MKNTLLKYYILAIYFFSNVVLFAQATPGAEDTTDTLEESTGDTTPLPIDDYILIVAVIGLIFVFLKYRSIQNAKLNS